MRVMLISKKKTVLQLTVFFVEHASDISGNRVLVEARRVVDLTAKKFRNTQAEKCLAINFSFKQLINNFSHQMNSGFPNK